MGYDIYIGKLKDDAVPYSNYNGGPCYRHDDFDNCDGLEPEGTTDPEYTIHCGSPVRAASYSGWREFTKKIPEFDVLTQDGSDGHTFFLSKYPELIEAVREFVSKGVASAIDLDRARWFLFWSEEAIKRYGEKAIIIFL